MVLTDVPQVVGLTQLRPIVALGLSRTPQIDVDVAAAVLALALLGVGVWLGRRETAAGRLRYGAPGLIGIWSLLTFFHLTYGFILLIPLAVALRFDDNARTAVFRSRLFWLLQLGLMVDVPGVWRRLATLWPLPPALDAVAAHADRGLMLLLFISVAWLVLKRRPAHGPVCS